MHSWVSRGTLHPLLGSNTCGAGGTGLTPRTFLPSRTTSMANFIAIHPVVWISIESKQTHTHTHCSWFSGWLNLKECNEVHSTILGGIILRKLHYGAFDRWSGLEKYQVGRCPLYCHSVLTDDQIWIDQIHLITLNESFACTINPAAYYYAAATTTIFPNCADIKQMHLRNKLTT